MLFLRAAVTTTNGIQLLFLVNRQGRKSRGISCKILSSARLLSFFLVQTLKILFKYHFFFVLLQTIIPNVFREP